MSTHNEFNEEICKIIPELSSNISVPFHLFGNCGGPIQLGKKRLKSQNWERSCAILQSYKTFSHFN